MSRRDLMAGLLVTLAVAIGVLGPAATGSPDGVRAATMLVIALGLTAAVVGGAWGEWVTPATVRAPAALGVVAAGAAVLALVSGSAEALIALVVVITALWAVAILRHATTGRR
ncbi:hypothetical protein [Actinomycetospora chibensis]|uniref:Uncharacterized protein n=1 Tax=Actinomycetospora chibensis TaxID=663606 RepID=A0ABV9RM30_9PSEU|nr:hypothetical protein [Actinomycetospora chibensis]MDD7922208.1 hypothetical protein [Actinomycetospora chibensis]